MADSSAQQRPGGLVVPQVARILPGPAGKLQQLAAAGALQQATPEVLGLKDQYNLQTHSQASYEDACFRSHTWTQARQFAEGAGGQLHTIRMAKELSLGKVPKILVVLGAIQPSGPSSAFCKVKDPTGSIGAAIHRSVLQHPQYQQGQMVPGTVLLLQQCSVFTPAPGTSYLAVTANNIIKVWRGESANARIRHAQHQPTQQPQQQETADMPRAQPAAGIAQIQQQQQTQQQQGDKVYQQQRRPPQQQDSPSAAGSNRSSLFPPPSPDVSSIFLKHNQQSNLPPQPPVQQHVPIAQQQQQQQQLPHQQPWQPPHADNSRQPNSTQPRPCQSSPQHSQQQQQQIHATDHASMSNHGLMLPPAPRISTSGFRAPVQQQQQTQQQLHRPPPSQLLDSFLDDLVDLEHLDAEVPTAGGPVARPSAPPATATAAGARISSMMRSSSGTQSADTAATPRGQQQPSQQQARVAQQYQQQGPDSQFVPGALLQQIKGNNSMPSTANPLHQLSTVAAQASGGDPMPSEPHNDDDAVDDVVTAIFGSQMGPAALPGQPRLTAGRPAAASNFGSQLGPPLAAKTTSSGPGSCDLFSRPLNAEKGQAHARQSRAAMPVRHVPPGAGFNSLYMTPAAGPSSVPAPDAAAALERSEPQQKRFKESPAVSSSAAGRPLAPHNLNANLQQQQHLQGRPSQWSGLQQTKVTPADQVIQQAVKPMAKSATPGTSGAVPQAFGQPGRVVDGFRAVGAVSLLDDLVGDELDELGVL